MTNSKNLSKLKLLAVATILGVISILFLAGCGGTELRGTWTLDRIVTDSSTITADTEDKGEYGDDFNNILTFAENGSGTVKIRSETATTSEWVQDGNKVTITVGSDDSTYTLDGEELIFEQENVKYFYKKTTQ